MSKKPALFLIFALLLWPAFAPAQDDSTETKPQAEEKKETPQAMVEEKPVSELTAEAKICTGIEERMPTGKANAFPTTVDRVYLWSRILGAKDSTFIRHVWYYKGNEMADVKLNVNSASWRTYSTKTILPSWTGDWEVKVFDANEIELTAVKFKVGE